MVVENIERLMHEEHLDAKAAALKSMQEISGALVGITLVLTAVFIPMAFFGSMTGVIYRQFSITLVVAMLLSLLVALVITPSFAAQLLKRQQQPARWAQRFNHGMGRLTQGYQSIPARTMRFKFSMLALFALCVLSFGWLYKQLPEGLMPTEDMGFVMAQIIMPGNAPRSEVEKIGREVEDYLWQHESERIQSVGIWYSGNNVGVGPYRGQVFIVLKDWAQRPSDQDTVFAIVDRAQKHFAQHNMPRFTLWHHQCRAMGVWSIFGYKIWTIKAANFYSRHLAKLTLEHKANPVLNIYSSTYPKKVQS